MEPILQRIPGRKLLLLYPKDTGKPTARAVMRDGEYKMDPSGFRARLADAEATNGLVICRADGPDGSTRVYGWIVEAGGIVNPLSAAELRHNLAHVEPEFEYAEWVDR